MYICCLDCMIAVVYMYVLYDYNYTTTVTTGVNVKHYSLQNCRPVKRWCGVCHTLDSDIVYKGFILL